PLTGGAEARPSPFTGATSLNAEMARHRDGFASASRRDGAGAHVLKAGRGVRLVEERLAALSFARAGTIICRFGIAKGSAAVRRGLALRRRRPAANAADQARVAGVRCATLCAVGSHAARGVEDARKAAVRVDRAQVV